MKNKIIIAIVSVAVVLLCVGSLVLVEHMDEQLRQEKLEVDYSLVQEDGKNYIVFEDITEYTYQQSNGLVSENLTFSSMKEFRDSVTKGLLQDWQKRKIANDFEKDKDGNVLTCDFDNLYTPVLPAEGEIAKVNWSGRVYSIWFSFKNCAGHCRILPEKVYKKLFREEYTNIFMNPRIDVTKTEPMENNGTVTYYTTSTAEVKVMQYSFSDGERTVYVDRYYLLKCSAPSASESETIPNRIHMYCNQGDHSYIVFLANFTEDPTDEWLMEFGIEKFVDNGDAEK